MIISQIKKRTRNLFNINAVELSANCELVGNGIKFNGSGSFDIVLPAGIYTISCKNNGLGPCYIRNGKVSSGYIASLSWAESVKTFNFTADVDGCLRISSFTSGHYLEDIQIEKGVTATEYIPYEFDVTQLNNKPISNITVNGVDYNFAEPATADGGLCENAVKEPIIDMRIGGNSIQDGDPTPENPVEIQSVGEKTKNLFNEGLLLLQNSSYIEKTSEGYLVKYYPATFQTSDKSGFINHLKSVLKPGVTYTLSRKINNYTKGSDGSIWIRDGEKNIVELPYGLGIKSKTFTLTQEQIDSIDKVYIYGRQGDTPILFEYIQLEEGKTATEYEPYGYKIPINTLPLGKNLFNIFAFVGKGNANIRFEDGKLILPINTATNSNGYTGTNVKLSTYCPRLAVGDVVTLSLNTTGSKSFIYLSEFKYTIRSGQSFTVTQEMLDSSVVFYGNDVTKGEVEQVIISNVQIEYGDTATAFEPYRKPVENIYLNEPLRKIGDYADYIDYKNKKVIRNIGEKVINGTENIAMSAASGDMYNGDYSTNRYFNIGYVGAEIMPSTTNQIALVNGLPFNQHVWTKTSEIGFCANAGYQFHMRFPNVILGIGVEDDYLVRNEKFSNYLKQLYDNSTPVIINYALRKSIEETIDIPEILMTKEDNNITIDTTIAPSELTVEYWKQIGVE